MQRLFEEPCRKSKEEAGSFSSTYAPCDRLGILSRSDKPCALGPRLCSHSWEGAGPGCSWAPASQATAHPWRRPWSSTGLYLRLFSYMQTVLHASYISICPVNSPCNFCTAHGNQPLAITLPFHHLSSTKLTFIARPHKKAHCTKPAAGRCVGASPEVSRSFCFAGTLPT